VLYWPLDEGGATATEIIRAANGTRNAGAVALAAGAPLAKLASRSTSFDGAGGYVEVANPGSLLDGKKLSAFAWIKHAAAGTSGPRIIDRVYNGQFALYVREATLDVALSLVDSLAATGTGISAASSIVTGTWQFVGGTWDGNSIIMYVNGVASGTPTSRSGTGLASSTSIIRIGQRVDSPGNDRDWEGNIAHCAVWDRALSAAEIKALYLTGIYGA